MAGPVRQANEHFLALLDRNPVLREVLGRLDALDLPDAWVAGGCLFQTVWNLLSGEAPTRAIADYDVFYFDPQDLGADAEEQVNRRAADLFADLGCRIDARNQARVHLWYAREFGVEGYPQLTRTTDGIDHFLAVCCMVGVRRRRDGSPELYAPHGVDDILSRVMRPNPGFPLAPREAFERKAARWLALWPELVVRRA
jgi:uncharacterized protein